MKSLLQCILGEEYTCWGAWGRYYMDGLQRGDLLLYWITLLGMLILVFTSWGIVRRTRRYAPLGFLNIIYLASVALKFITEVLHGTILPGYEDYPSDERLLARAVVQGLLQVFVFFYISIVFLVLLLLCMLRGGQASQGGGEGGSAG